ncbi:MAG: flagellar export chaperone FliS, partial [Desulfovibrionaceae bacterium]|nr:flagellar export chaperone FliS [Desulfovibrionaceae bacterium]
MSKRTYFSPRRQEVSQGQLLVELYDGALQYLRKARDQMVAQRYSARNLLLNCAIEIIDELAKSLDTHSGGDLAVKLNNLYLLCSSRLLRANQRMCVDDLDTVVVILKRLRDIYSLFPG